MNLLLLYRIKSLPKNTNGRLAIPALAGLLVLISPLNDLSYDCTRRTLFVLLLQLCSVHLLDKAAVGAVCCRALTALFAHVLLCSSKVSDWLIDICACLWALLRLTLPA